MRIGLGVILLGGVMAFCPPVHAQPEASPSGGAQPFRLSWRSSTACTDPREFITKLGARTSELRPADAGETALSVQVELVPTATGVRGQLELRDLDGALTLRVIPARDCNEALSAMALITALMVDPFARSSVAVEPMPPVHPVQRVRENRSTSETEPTAIVPLEFGLGQRLNVQGGVLPGESWGVSAFGELGIFFGGIFHPRLRIAGMYARKSIAIEGDGLPGGAAAEFTWANARLSLCPVRFAFGKLGVRPCAFWDAGSLQAEGVGTDQAEPVARVFWSAVGALVEAELQLLGPLSLGGEAGAVFPLLRDGFYIEPRGPEGAVHDVPAAGWLAALGLGLRFD